MFATLFTSLGSKIALGLGVLLVLAALVIGLQHYRSDYLAASQKLAQATANLSAVQHQATAQVAALQAQSAQAMARQKQSEKIRTVILHEPVTMACAKSPAVQAVLDGLRKGSAQ